MNLGIGLAQEGKKVLLIDGDPQGSLTISLGYEEPDEMEYSLATLMMNIVNDEKLNIEKTILHHKEGVDLIPANIELSAIEVSLVNAMSRELILKSMVEKLRDFYDFIIIDCMPSLGMMTINALACADSVLIPVQAAYLPVKGLQQLIKTIGRVYSEVCPHCSFARLEYSSIFVVSNTLKSIYFTPKIYGNTFLKVSIAKRDTADARVKQLEAKLKEEENLQIVSDVASYNLSPEQLAQFLQLANSGRLQDMLSGQAPMPAAATSGKETDAEEDNEQETGNEEEDFLDEENE